MTAITGFLGETVPEIPPVTLGIAGKRVDIVTEGSQAETTMLKTDKPLLLWSKSDHVRYYELMEQQAQNKVQEKEKEKVTDEEGFEMIFKLMEELSVLLSRSTDMLYSDSRGLVCEMKMSYPE